jgi:uncharacterized protein (TIGR03435 family)
MKNQPFRRLVAIAYRIPADRVKGGPKWVDDERFDIEARAGGPAKDPELMKMLQALLAERFQFASHRETANVSAYALTVLKSGLKLRPDEGEGPSRSNSSRGKLVAQRITLARLAEGLTRIVGMPVVDMTNTAGAYSFTLEWSPETAPPDPPAGPSLFDVLPEKLGVKLENRKVAVETIVIDKAERPSEN